MRRMIGAALGLSLLAFAVPAGAHDLTPAPSKVVTLTASSGAGAVSVGGRATFGGQKLLSVGVDVAGDALVPLGPYDLLEAEIGQLNAVTGDFTFVLKLADLPFGGSIPEAARYIWDFAIDMGEGTEPILLDFDGKYTDVIRRQNTNIPAFILEGNCTTDENNIITCQKIADLTAEMIGSDNEIFVDIPRALLEQEAGGSLDGARIVPAQIFEGIGAYPAAVVTPGGTGDLIVQDPDVDSYSIAYKKVDVTIQPPGGEPLQTVAASLNSDGTFEASLDSSTLAPGIYHVVASGCFGTNCGTKTVSVTI